MSVTSGTNVLSKRYAGTLLDLASKDKLVEKVEKDLSELQSMMKSSADLDSVLKSPVISKSQKRNAITTIATKAKFQKITSNFLAVLAENGRLDTLGGIILAFNQALSQRRGEIEAKIETAFALSPAQTKTLQTELGKALGSNVTINVSVNKDLLGGLIVTVGSRMIDNSVRRKLEKLQREMSRGVMQQEVAG